ncbi:MAG TPA: osmotically inducible protein OsmC [Bacteroidetes bacterium]|nr:osmotically inducible protein OsmC [Bacteroidota bacterium]
MVAQSTLYLGQLRCKAVHGPSAVELVTDAPTDNQGRGESFSPTDLVVTALATCKVTTMGIVAQRDHVSLDGTKVYAEKHMSADQPRRIARIVIKIDFPPGIAPGYRQKLELTARTCPVAKSLHPDVLLDVTFSYAD